MLKLLYYNLLTIGDICWHDSMGKRNRSSLGGLEFTIIFIGMTIYVEYFKYCSLNSLLKILSCYFIWKIYFHPWKKKSYDRILREEHKKQH